MQVVSTTGGQEVGSPTVEVGSPRESTVRTDGGGWRPCLQHQLPLHSSHPAQRCPRRCTGICLSHERLIELMQDMPRKGTEEQITNLHKLLSDSTHRVVDGLATRQRLFADTLCRFYGGRESSYRPNPHLHPPGPPNHRPGCRGCLCTQAPRLPCPSPRRASGSRSRGPSAAPPRGLCR